MAIPLHIQKSLVMKPEVSKIFDDLEAWLDHCRFELIDFNPAHLYKSREYKDWSRGYRSHNNNHNNHDKKYRRPYRGRE